MQYFISIFIIPIFDKTAVERLKKLSSISTHFIYNELEYFTYINFWLLGLFIFVMLLFYLSIISSIFYNTIYSHSNITELLLTISSTILLFLIVSPCLLLLLEYNSTLISSTLISVTALQWLWEFTYSTYSYAIGSFTMPFTNSGLIFNVYYPTLLCLSSIISDLLSTGFIGTLYDFSDTLRDLVGSMFTVDSGIITTSYLSNSSMFTLFFNTNLKLVSDLFINHILIYSTKLCCNLYVLFSAIGMISSMIFFSSNFTTTITSSITSSSISTSLTYLSPSSILILSINTSLKFILISYDVIHSFGLNEFGIKLDTIPGRINSSLFINSILFSGIYNGFCYELCGRGHSIMYFNIGMI